MWVGFSKSLGGGFRVGVGTRIGGRSSRRRSGPTQAQIAKLEKAQFIKNIAEESNQSLQEYLVNNNIDPVFAERKKLDLDDLLGKGDTASQYQKFKASISEVNEIISKVNYGGNLTASRKDRLVDLVFELREIVGESGPGLNELATQISKKSEKTSIITFSVFLSIVAVLMAVGSFVDDKPITGIADVIPLVMGTGFVAAILYLPAHLVIKMIAKVKYNRQAVAKTKQQYGLA
ncbi:hypothetical protein [Ketobacter sp. GenoA1]|uniref:hypothetical protein n=1 Tax=Ketobacter sp. GenoA1 TaxID=2072747 RepID=UPI000F1D931B|nr:hypothetical protein [Ketobacter sp. GenoA1]RLT90987.1 MAG: hypothetical protein D9N13_05030 [Ketobacter sp. GenoA1]